MNTSSACVLILAAAVAAAAQDSLTGQDPIAVFLRSGSRSSVPLEEILPGGPAVDGIPAISWPKKAQAKEADDFLDPEDRVLGVALKGEATAYPIRLLNWHEIVNDTVGGVPIAATYCPLRGTGIAFERRLDGEVVEFGVSGLLYRRALVMYDRRSKSLWSQILGKAIVGPSNGRTLTRFPATLTTWKEWKAKHPGTLAVTFDTGHIRDYRRDPYATRRTP